MGKILSVDDSPVMRRIIGSAVEVLGYDFLEAGEADTALQVLQGVHDGIDLILLDVNMPGINGFELLEKLKADKRYKDIPTMMVTTESERMQIVRAIRVGAANYVCKPFTQEELMTKMVESLGQGLEF